ncbi:hypothetical protein DFH29DRAFT_974886 [Suillus ampliporus]|nr:hypothetical protein DFH29DRAFT_974886 [Suillus ampliporus]
MLEEFTRNSKLWIPVLKDPQTGKGHCHPFIRFMSKQMVAHLKDVVDPYHWPEFIQSNAGFANNIVTYKRHLIVKHQRTLQRPAASLHTWSCEERPSALGLTLS